MWRRGAFPCAFCERSGRHRTAKASALSCFRAHVCPLCDRHPVVERAGAFEEGARSVSQPMKSGRNVLRASTERVYTKISEGARCLCRRRRQVVGVGEGRRLRRLHGGLRARRCGGASTRRCDGAAVGGGGSGDRAPRQRSRSVACKDLTIAGPTRFTWARSWDSHSRTPASGSNRHRSRSASPDPFLEPLHTCEARGTKAPTPGSPA